MKKILFSSILVLIMYLMMEVLSLATHFAKWGNYSLYEIQHSKMDAIDALNTQGVYLGEDQQIKDLMVRPIIHPYTGYIVEG